MLEDLVASSRKAEFLDRAGEWEWAGVRKYLKLTAANYGVTVDVLKRLTAESLDVFGQVSRPVLRDEDAQFRSSQQEEAVRLATAKQSPLVAVLPTGGGKSLVFMVPAMLAGAGVTIVVAPYAELKRQLVTRCVDAGLDCK
ncbi:uncharacterized protein B0J16DRAFT_252671, partial [Fusarium flagelliforme]|uniref:uncharacterized protein n=1 Tax=Fusarium flagelliforme TaxID=2675880 RepID=UPI001E8CFF46